MALPPGVCVAAAEYVLWYLYSGVLREGPLAVHRVTRGALELARLWEVEAVATFVGRLLQRRFSDTLATAVPLPAAAAAADAPAAAGSALLQPQQQRRRFQLCRAAGADLVLRCCDAERGTVACSCSRVLLCARSTYFSAMLEQGRWAEADAAVVNIVAVKADAGCCGAGGRGGCRSAASLLVY